MKIGIYDMYLDALGGGEKYMLSIATHLSHNHSVDLFWDDKTILSKAEKRFSLNYSHLNIVKNIFLSPLSFFEKKKKMESYDLIIYLSDGSIPFLFGKKNIIHFQFPTPWVNGKTVINKLKLSRVSKIISNSLYTKSYIDNTFNSVSEVLYPPCTMFANKQKKENMILTVGRLNVLSEKNDFKKLEFMMHVFSDSIFKQFPTWKLVLVVTYFPQDKKIIDRWREQYTQKNIEFVENATFTTLRKLYETAAVYWHAAGYGETIKEHPERAEHFGIAPVEAMSAGAVPILVNAGGIPEIIEHGKNGFLWSTEEELVAQTKELLKNNSLRNNISVKAAQRAQTFSEQAFTTQLDEIISSL